MTSVKLTSLDAVKGHFFGVAHSGHIGESLNTNINRWCYR